MEATGALEELLLEQRALIDHALYSVLEDAPLGDLLEHFQSTLLGLQQQEPSFWHLQVVDFIRSVFKSRVGSCIDAEVKAAASKKPQNPDIAVNRAKAQVQTSSELQEALVQLQRDVEMEVARIKDVLTEKHLKVASDMDEHFLVKFWTELQDVIGTKANQHKLDEEPEVEGVEQELESCSLERFSFDEDFNDLSRSAMSFPCMEDFPMTIRRMQSADVTERAAGLDEFLQIPIPEIIHSGPIFPTACSAVVGLFLDTGERCAERAKRVVYDLMNQVEDAAQFLELFWAVLDFMGARLETGELFLYRREICDAQSIAAVDCFRVLHALLFKTMRHWVYLAAEALAQVLHSTFRLLITYSKAETEVETKRLTPLTMLFLVDNDPVRWFKLWLLNAPSSRQLFVAMDESGFIADLLQNLSRFRPLSFGKSSNRSVNAIEKRIAQCMLAILSCICEYQQGRDLVGQWQRLPAHAYIKQRRTSWKKCALENNAMENDSLYHTVQQPASAEELRDELGADYSDLGKGVVDALILSVAAVIVTTSCSQKDTDVLFTEQWSTSISRSVATYLHCADAPDLLPALTKIVEACWTDKSCEISATSVQEETNSWFPFRQPKSVAEVCQLVIDSVLKRTRRGVVDSDLQSSGTLILRLILSSKAADNAVTQSSSSETTERIFELCKRYLQSPHYKVTASSGQHHLWTCDPSALLGLITDTAVVPQAFEVAERTGVIDELWKVSKQCEGQECSRLGSRITIALLRSVSGVRNMSRTMTADTCMQNHVAAQSFRDLLGILSYRVLAQSFFNLVDVQATISQSITALRETIDFSISLNSPDDECPSQIVPQITRLQWLRCCLSSQFAASSLLSSEDNALVQFISEALTVHRAGFCMSSSHAEDTCCVAFQLLIALVSSVPSMLECSSLLSKLKVLNLDDKCTLQRGILNDISEILGPCSFLEKQLCYEFEFIGGPSEKLPQCELFEFDGRCQETQIDSKDTTGERADRTISEFAGVLQNKILQAIGDGVEAGSSTPMDFVLISQASWELIHDLEARFGAESPFVCCNPAGPANELFARLTFNLVMSQRSRLEPARSVAVALIQTTSPTPNSESFFPTDSERKLMNRLYKNYASGLSLESSPTLLHCTVKKFGKIAMDCFPVTMLMLLHPTFDEADILNFLSHCLASPSAGYLWPRSADRGVAVVITKGVEIILAREFPQILQAIDRCQCSLLSLVLRWHSQSFWNYLAWENVVLYTYFSVLYGVELQVFLMMKLRSVA